MNWAGIPRLDLTGDDAKLRLEAGHWWYLGRRRIVLEALERLDLPAAAEILDAGCGNGSMLEGLSRFGRVTGVDLNPLALERARHGGTYEVLSAPVDRLPVADGRFDVVTSLDVLEHIVDDRAALAELLRVTRPGGALLVTVPAYPRLWSGHDQAAGHRRRYRRSELIERAAGVGWAPVVDTHFNAVLLPVAALWRKSARGRSRTQSDLLRTASWLNGILKLPLTAEAHWLASRHRIRFGLSILAVFVRRTAGS